MALSRAVCRRMTSYGPAVKSSGGRVGDRLYVGIGIGTIRSESGDMHPIWFIGLLEKGIRL